MRKEGINGRELIDWVSQNDLLMTFTPEQSDVIVKALAQGGYSLTLENEKLILIQESQQGMIAKEMVIDDLIDKACEVNYEKLQGLKEESKKLEKRQPIARLKLDIKLAQCQIDHLILEKVFEKTVYKRYERRLQKLKQETEQKITKATHCKS